MSRGKTKSRGWKLVLGTAAVMALGAAPIPAFATTASGARLSTLVSGEPAKAGTGMAAVLQTNGNQDVYYVGADNNINAWFWDGHHWSNGPLSGGELAKTGTGMAAVLAPSNGNQDLYYVGANSGIYAWYWNGHWNNGPL